MKWWFAAPLWARIMGALALGIVVGYAIRAGYAGWGAGQLEDELARNAWLNVAGSRDILFDVPAGWPLC